MWINVNGTEWRRARTTGTAEKIVVHELFHALQLRRGWARAAPSWLFEGAAEYVAWRGALVEKGVYSADVARGCHIWGVHYSISAAGQPAPIGRLQEYEAGFPLDVPVYSLFYLAVDFLMQSHPITALVSVQDTDFETTFGRSLPSFYSDFEEYRSTWTLPSSTDNYQCN